MYNFIEHLDLDTFFFEKIFKSAEQSTDHIIS